MLSIGNIALFLDAHLRSQKLVKSLNPRQGQKAEAPSRMREACTDDNSWTIYRCRQRTAACWRGLHSPLSGPDDWIAFMLSWDLSVPLWRQDERAKIVHRQIAEDDNRSTHHYQRQTEACQREVYTPPISPGQLISISVSLGPARPLLLAMSHGKIICTNMLWCVSQH